MQSLQRIFTQLSIKTPNLRVLSDFPKRFSTENGSGNNSNDKKEPDWAAHFGGSGSSDSDPLGWDMGPSSWSTGLTKEHFDGEVVGQQVEPGSDRGRARGGGSSQNRTGNWYSEARWTDQEMVRVKELEAENRKGKAFVDGWDDRMKEMTELMKQVREPGARGSYLKDSEKAEMYKKHKENPELYTVERLAKDYRIMKQRVHAILWLKELEEEEEKKLGHPLDDSVELLLDTCPEFFISHDREFHVASLPYKPDFKVMPEGWDGTTRDPDEVHYEISMKEDEILYQEFVQRMDFNKMKMAKKVKCHKYSRRRPSEGWNFMVEKLGPKGKRGNGGGWKFISIADGSSRPLNEFEKMFVKRETPRRRRKILP
ncbi:mucin-related [Forsythia ovata]|uniref:Mucin-related n=1 Tax=Forsythia ovata TaxID=205694 RepID=A0ABD1RJL0_9LAMI